MPGELKHTPGPWHAPHICDESHTCNCLTICEERYASGIATVVVGNKLQIGQGGVDGPPMAEAAANARLISAAPDLLEALKAATETLATWTADHSMECTAHVDAVLHNARAAIHRAEGKDWAMTPSKPLQRLEEISEREKRATEGPWGAWNGCSWWRIGREEHQSSRPVIEPTNDSSDGHPNLTGPNLRDDLEFIAHARTDIPWLLQRVRELEAALKPLAVLDAPKRPQGNASLPLDLGDPK